MNLRKSLTLTLAGAMLLSTVACTSESSSSGATSSPTSTATSPGAATTNDGLPPISEVKAEFTIGTKIAGDTTLEETLVMQRTLSQVPNMDIEFTYWMDNEPRNLAFNSGNYPEVVIGNYVLETSDAQSYSQQGILVAFDDYVSPELTPNIQRAFDEIEDYKTDLNQIDGKVYYLASANHDMSQARQLEETWWINKNWLEAVDKEVPTTLDEFYDVLKAFDAAGDLNGNGDDDEIPFGPRFAARTAKVGINSLAGAWGMPSDPAASTPHMLRDGQVTYSRSSDAWKNTLAYMNMLWEEGLVDPEMFTMTNDMHNGRIGSTTPIYGAFVAWDDSNARAAQGYTREDPDYVPIYPMKATADSPDPKWFMRTTNTTHMIPYLAITNKAVVDDEVEAIMRFVDLYLSPENSLDTFFGEEGVHYESIGNNQYQLLLKDDGTHFTEAEKEYVAGLGAPGLLCPSFYTPLELDPTDPTLSDSQYYHLNYYVDGYHPYLDTEIVPPTVQLTAEETDTVLNLKVEVENYTVSKAAEFITQGGIEEGWDQYLAELDALGLPVIIDTHQTAYDRWLSLQ